MFRQSSFILGALTLQGVRAQIRQGGAGRETAAQLDPPRVGRARAWAMPHPASGAAAAEAGRGPSAVRSVGAELRGDPRGHTQPGLCIAGRVFPRQDAAEPLHLRRSVSYLSPGVVGKDRGIDSMTLMQLIALVVDLGSISLHWLR